MGAWAKIIAACLVLAGILAIGNSLMIFESDDVKLDSSTVVGEVLSIEDPGPNDHVGPSVRIARVKLTTGETVRASAPAACPVFPGQNAELTKMTHPAIDRAIYIVRGPKG